MYLYKLNTLCLLSDLLWEGLRVTVKRSNADWGVRSVAEVHRGLITELNCTGLCSSWNMIICWLSYSRPRGHEGKSTQICKRLALHWILTGFYNLEGLVNTTTPTNTTSCYSHTMNRILAMHWPDKNFGRTLHACHKWPKNYKLILIFQLNAIYSISIKCINSNNKITVIILKLNNT